MSEQDDSHDQDDKPHEASPRRLEQARERGQVAKSKELHAAVSLLTAALLLWALRQPLWSGFIRTGQAAWGGLHGADPQRVGSAIDGMVFVGVLTLLAATVVSAIAGGLMQHGPLLAWKALEPDVNKLNPVKGLKRLMSVGQIASTSGKTLLLTLLIGGVVLWLAVTRWPRQVGMASQAPGQIAGAIWDQVAALMACCGAVMAVVGLFDLLYARHRQEKQLRMTHEEAKREHKEQEGDPLYKARRRQHHQALLEQRRMLEDVSTATVILNNPTHLSVALRYRPEEGVPVVVARGHDALAMQIRARAERHQITQIEDVPLARALYSSCRVGEPIPQNLYRAVALVLARVFAQPPKRSA